MSTPPPNRRDRSKSKLKLVLFVEGTSGPSLDGLWKNAIPVLLGLSQFERVVGFSKHNLVAMSNANMALKHKTSTISVGLDEIIARELKRQPFDCAIVAWDLVPAWDSGSDASACRWTDTLLLYEGLSRSKVLSDDWRKTAKQRFEEMSSRVIPSARRFIPRPAVHTVLGICMEPEFEGMMMHEAGVKTALGLKGRIKNWPDTWSKQSNPRPSDTLAKAIEAARRVHPRPAIFRKVRLPLREAKHDWGKLLITEAKGDFRQKLIDHAIAQRLHILLSDTFD